jgi:hypothetical protein
LSLDQFYVNLSSGFCCLCFNIFYIHFKTLFSWLIPELGLNIFYIHFKTLFSWLIPELDLNIFYIHFKTLFSWLIPELGLNIFYVHFKTLFSWLIPELGLNLLAASTFSKDLYNSLKYLIIDMGMIQMYNCPIWLITIYDIVHAIFL